MGAKGAQSKFVRIITIPIRVLSKARDFYVKSLTECTQGMPSGASNYGALPRSFSTASSMSGDGDDYRELMRVASLKSLGHRSEAEILLQEKLKEAKLAAAGAGRLPKSCSVGMGRIDEDKAVEFGEVEEVVEKKKADLLYPRSRSYAVPKRNPLV